MVRVSRFIVLDVFPIIHDSRNLPGAESFPVLKTKIVLKSLFVSLILLISRCGP